MEHINQAQCHLMVEIRVVKITHMEDTLTKLQVLEVTIIQQEEIKIITIK